MNRYRLFGFLGCWRKGIVVEVVCVWITESGFRSEFRTSIVVIVFIIISFEIVIAIVILSTINILIVFTVCVEILFLFVIILGVVRTFFFLFKWFIILIFPLSILLFVIIYNRL